MVELELRLPPGALRQFKTLARISRVGAAKALTFTAEKGVPAWRGGHGVFHRRNSWIDKGVRMRAATASNITAQVGTLDKYMGRHIKGIGEPKVGRLFTPAYDDVSAVGKHTRERGKLRRMASTKRKPFVILTGAGPMLVRRKGKKRTPLVVLGFMRRRAEVEQRLDALDIVADVTAREFPTVYQRLLVRWAETGRM